MLTVIVVIAALHAAADGVSVSAHGVLEPAEIPFHRVANYRVTAEGPAALELRVAAWPDAVPGLLVSAGEPVVTPLPGDRQQLVQEFTLTPSIVTRYTLPAVRVLADGVEAVVLEPRELVVRDLTAEEKAAASVAADLITLAELEGPGLGAWFVRILAFAAGCTLIAVLPVGYRAFRRRFFPQREASPDEAAAAALAALERDLQDGGITCDAFYVELSGVLRTYLGARFAVPVIGQSTPEFLAETLERLQLAPAQSASVRDLLVEFDRVKFAQHAPDRAEQAKSLRSVRDLIAGMEARADTEESAALRGAA